MRIVVAAGLAALVALGGGRAEAAEYKRGDTITGRAIAADGDTLLMDGGLRVRLFGIDTAEMDVWPWGPLGRAVLDEQLGGIGTVTCDVVDMDRKRPVARCQSGTGVDMAVAVVRAGYATVWRTFVYPRSIPAALDELDLAEAEARSAGRGLWAER